MGVVERPGVTRDVPCSRMRVACGNRGQPTMERRKFIIGAGALATGSAAAVGTGAFTTATASRNAEVTIAEDSEGFVEITEGNGVSGDSSRYAKQNSDGQLELNFNDEVLDGGDIIGSVDGKGLNPNTAYTFSEVFTIGNIGGFGQLDFVIEESGFDGEVNLSVSGEGQAMEVDAGTSLNASDYESTSNIPRIGNPGSCVVNMEITTEDSPNAAAGGTLTIHAATVGNADELSDVIGE